MRTSRALYRQRCAKCHGTDGKGDEAREDTPKIPDFTSRAWQAQRSDAQLRTSILDGRGKDMPAFSPKITREQAQSLVVLIRQFGPTPVREAQDPSSDFDKRFRELQDEFGDLQRQYRELSTSSRKP
jgi:mono/diheme cytochrome c family protein